jgi:hypothetical protein
MNIKEIKEMPTVVDDVHESVYRSYHILQFVREHLCRLKLPGDTKLLIEVIDYLSEQPVNVPAERAEND